MCSVRFVLVHQHINEKDKPCRVLVHVLYPCKGGMPLYIQVNKFSWQAILSATLVCCRGARPAGHKLKRGTSPPPNLLSKGHYNHPNRSNIRVKRWEHLSFEERRCFLIHKFHPTEHLRTRGRTYLFGLLEIAVLVHLLNSP